MRGRRYAGRRGEAEAAAAAGNVTGTGAARTFVDGGPALPG